MSEYKIERATADGIDEALDLLADAVRVGIAEGWHPVGGVSIAAFVFHYQSGPYDTPTEQESYVAAQALMRGAIDRLGG